MAEPGDLIEIIRDTYSQFALFVGNGYVIHLTQDDASTSSTFGASSGSSKIGTVRKEKVKDLASGDIWMVNYSLDEKYEPRSPDVIKTEAEQQVGKKIPYDLFTCQHFVTKLRYGQPVSMPVATKQGDLIAIKKGVFSHWALFVGDGDVIHFITKATPQEVILGIGASTGSADTVIGTVKKEKLVEVALDGQWLVHNLLDNKHKPKSPDVILKEAELLVGRNMSYNVITNNCEHFVTNLRYGIPESRQVRDALEAAASGSLLMGGLFGASVSLASNN